jgi:hypothetical protein
MFAQGVEAGSAKVISAIGDEHNALILVTVRTSLAPGAPKLILPVVRLYLVDDNRRIVPEKVIFYAAAENEGRLCPTNYHRRRPLSHLDVTPGLHQCTRRFRCCLLFPIVRRGAKRQRKEEVFNGARVHDADLHQ